IDVRECRRARVSSASRERFDGSRTTTSLGTKRRSPGGGTPLRCCGARAVCAACLGVLPIVPTGVLSPGTELVMVLVRPVAVLVTVPAAAGTEGVATLGAPKLVGMDIPRLMLSVVEPPEGGAPPSPGMLLAALPPPTPGRLGRLTPPTPPGRPLSCAWAW